MEASEDYPSNMERAANRSGVPPVPATTTWNTQTQPSSPGPPWRTPAASWLSQTTGYPPPEVQSGCAMAAPDAGAPSNWLTGTAVPGAGVVPPAARSGVAYAGWLTAAPGAGAPSAAPRSSAAYAHWLMGVSHRPQALVPPATGRGGVAYADGLMGVPDAAVPPAGRSSAVAYTGGATDDVLGSSVVEYPGISAMPSLGFRHGVAHPGPGELKAAATAVVRCTIDVPEGAAGRSVSEDDPGIRQIRVSARVVGDVDTPDGAFAEPERVPGTGGGGLGGLGVAVASLAVAGLTAGGAGAATPACAFGLFATLVAGVALVTAHVLPA